MNTRKNPMKCFLFINGRSLQKWLQSDSARVWRSTTLNTSKSEVFIISNYKRSYHNWSGRAHSILSLTNLTNQNDWWLSTTACRISGVGHWWGSFTTSSDWTGDWTWTTHLLIEKITGFFPSEMTRHSDFEQSPIHFIHFRIFGESGLSEEYVSNLMLDTDVQLKGVQECFTSDAPLYARKLWTVLRHFRQSLFVIWECH